MFRPLVHRFGEHHARRFAVQVGEFDRLVGEVGLVHATRRMLGCHLHALDVRGRAALPTDGPILFVANHPGLTDALALIAAIDDNRLALVAGARPFFSVLPQLLDRLILVPEAQLRRRATVRVIIDRLAAGGRIATFPTGAIEPDPALHRDGFAAVPTWSRQLMFLKRLVPEVQIVPVAISGVLNPNSVRRLFARIQWTEADRERAAAMLQVIDTRLRPSRVRVAFGEPLVQQTEADLIAAYAELADALWEDAGWTTLSLDETVPATST
ncbi:MAG: lysophospholipid acyltransferase family protein [Dehalococcoidia bacterium]